MSPLFVFALLMAIVRGLPAALNRRRKKPLRALCAECAFVHMQYGATGRNAVFCTFGGGVREVKLDVLYCTDYRDRNAPPRLVRVGFVPEAQMRGRAGMIGEQKASHGGESGSNG